jgi:hypothetical protein
MLKRRFGGYLVNGGDGHSPTLASRNRLEREVTGWRSASLARREEAMLEQRFTGKPLPLSAVRSSARVGSEFVFRLRMIVVGVMYVTTEYLW